MIFNLIFNMQANLCYNMTNSRNMANATTLAQVDEA